MTTAETIASALTTVEALQVLIPRLIANAKQAGELTAEQEADYRSRQASVFAQPYAQPEQAQPSPAPLDGTKPDL